MLSTFGIENPDSSELSGRGRGCGDSIRIRAVVPFLDEEERLGGLLEQLRDHGIDYLVAVDGGSQDRSSQIATERADEVREEPGGLARQLNHGAEGAHEDVLFFVYADSVLPAKLRVTIAKALEDPECVGGAFPLQLEDDRALYRWISRGANLRTRLGIGPFGDQGIFVRRTSFTAIGGYRSDQILEDFDLVSRLRSVGRFRVVGSPIRSSTRRWHRDGVLSTTAQHWWALGRHLAGIRRDSETGSSLDQVRTGGR